MRQLRDQSETVETNHTNAADAGAPGGLSIGRMTDDALLGRLNAAVLSDTDRRVAVAGFGLACAIGLVFAFVGLDTRSLWFDELFTAKLIEPWPATTLFGRIVTDLHPPLYLLTLGAFAQLLGDGENGLRLPSALAACGAIVVFVLGTRAAFSLPARLLMALGAEAAKVVAQEFEDGSLGYVLYHPR